MSLQKEFIENFKKEKYTTLNELAKQDLQNAIALLSADLYFDGIHFVLELIQNADDNKYDDNKNPFLKFIIESDKILIQNNEKGFAEENILAVCSVGKSTKTKKDGYIGEKGIGFKSVFRISDEPQIFSNNFHFKFKRVDEEYGLGYIVPYWIDEVPDLIDKKLTNILLPLNNEAKEDLLKFSRIEPELLLFLQKLHKIEIQNKVDNICRIYSKSEENGNVKLSSDESIKYFKLVSHTLEVPGFIHEEKRDITETKIILGFPLNPDGSAKAELEQKVFAFLPTRSYGFKFMIQADFLVPSSREDISKDKKWNEWLVDNISTVFLKSIDTFKQDESLKISFYNFIPTTLEISKDSIFPKVAEQLKSKLLDSSCVLTESAKWLKPSQVFRASEEVRSLISNEDLFNFFGKDYLSKEVEDHTKLSILNFLEISSFTTKDLIEILKNSEWLEKQSDNWLVKLYGYLENNLKNKTDTNAVKKLKIIRLKSGKMEAPDAPIFFPPDKKQSYGFEEHLPFIKDELLDAKEFLKYLGVSEPQPFEIIDNYILKDFESTEKSQNWQSRTEEVRIGYINYIKDNLGKYEEENDKLLNSGKNQWQKVDPLERLKSVIWIRYKTEEGRWFKRPNTLYLSKEYEAKNDLEFLFTAIEETHFVHPQYVELPQKEVISKELDTGERRAKLEEIKKDWKKFFVKVGVETKPKIEIEIAERNHYTSGYNHRKTTVKIFSSKLICSILDEPAAKRNLQLLKILDENWAYYKNYIKWNDCYFYYDWVAQVKISDWFVKITNSKWLPTKNGDLEQPAKLFLDKSEIRKILGDGVSYLSISIKNEDFAEALGINSEVNTETVISALKVLIEKKSNDKKRFNELYSFLDENFRGNEKKIKQYFQDENLIFIPENPANYVSTEKVLWNNVSEVFGSRRYYLGKHYPELKSFFLEKIGIKEKPLAKDYKDILTELSIKDVIEKDDIKKISKIYRELNNLLKEESSEDLSITEEDWWNDFIEEQIFWTNKLEFWRNDEDVFINDDEEIYELFNEKDEVAFLDLPQNENSRFEPFIKATKLKYLSKEVKSQLADPVDFLDAENLSRQISELLIYIFRYIYKNEHKIYEAAKQDGRLLQLINLRCYGVENLSIEYTLHTESAMKSNDLFLSGNNLFIKIDNFDRSDNLKDFDLISIELAKLFKPLTGLSDFIETLFFKSSTEKREESLKIRKIGGLPQDEYKWFIENSTQLIANEELTGILDRIENSDDEIRDESPVSEIKNTNHQQSRNYNHKNNSNPETVESNKTNQSLAKPTVVTKTTKVESSEQFKQNQVASTKNENNTKTDWTSEVDPWQVEINVSELELAGVKTANFRIEKSSQTKDRDLNDIDEEKESYQENLSQQARREIGKTGEIHALKALQNKFLNKYEKSELVETENGFNIFLNSQIKVEVNWLNKHTDCGVGRDIDYIENGEKYFVEVKATKTDSKEIFQISRAEWQLCKKEQENFSIFRVYNAGTNQAECKEIRNPYKKWLEERLAVQNITVRI